MYRNRRQYIPDHTVSSHSVHNLFSRLLLPSSAVNKYRRVETGLGQPVAEDKKAIARDNLVEEIADVELMLEQVKYLLQIPEDELLAVKTFKVNRTRERMESSK